MAEEGIEKVSWNIAASQAQYIFELLKKSMNFYQVGNLSKWYWTLTALREMMNYNLDTTKREILDKLEKSAQGSLKYWAKYRKLVEGHTEVKITLDELKKKNQFSNHVRVYQRKLMDLLNSLGYFPSKEDRSKVNF